MKSEIRNTNRGKMLFLTDGKTEIGCALEFGIRVSHLSAVGMENIYYEQPADCSDGLITEDDEKNDLDEIQKMTDKCMKDIDNILATKEKELMAL